MGTDIPHYTQKIKIAFDTLYDQNGFDKYNNVMFFKFYNNRIVLSSILETNLFTVKCRMIHIR